jgi:hypothetical protein
MRHSFGGETSYNRPCRTEPRVDIMKLHCDDSKWLELTHDHDQWRTLVLVAFCFVVLLLGGYLMVPQLQKNR